MNRIQSLLKLSKEELFSAEILLQNQCYRASVSRSYYAMYHLVQALLTAKNINIKTHKGLIQQFGQHFIKTEELPQDLSRILSDTFSLRQLSDYDETILITPRQAEIILEHLKRFIDETNNGLTKAGIL